MRKKIFFGVNQKFYILLYSIVCNAQKMIYKIFCFSSTGHVVVNYTVSSYSPYSSHRLPDNHHHTLASVLQWMVQSEWVGPYGVDPASHFLLSEWAIEEKLESRGREKEKRKGIEFAI